MPPAARRLEEVDLAEVAARFSRLLHDAGVPVTPERAGRFADVVALAAPATLPELYWLARVTLVAERAHIEVLDRVFAQVFGGLVDPADFRGDTASPPPATAGRRARPPVPAAPGRPGALPQPGATVADPGDEPGPPGPDREALIAVLSPDERLRHRDFADLTSEELARLRDMSGRMALAPPPRRTRRRVRAARGRETDVRATLRRAGRNGGEPWSPARRRRRWRPRRLVLLCDISGSMEPYARAYLQLLVSGVGGAGAEAFVFATRLTRLTPALRGASPDAALERAGRAAPDWSGGTRIGDALKAFNDGYGRRGLARGAVILVLSDGWDTGDPRVLGREMQRLRRLAFRIVWVNPRKAAPGYQPLAGGMAAALPHVDAFVSGHSRAAFDEVLEAIGSARRPGGPSGCDLGPGGLRTRRAEGRLMR